jgi:hypothetical protein
MSLVIICWDILKYNSHIELFLNIGNETWKLHALNNTH